MKKTLNVTAIIGPMEIGKSTLGGWIGTGIQARRGEKVVMWDAGLNRLANHTDKDIATWRSMYRRYDHLLIVAIDRGEAKRIARRLGVKINRFVTMSNT